MDRQNLTLLTDLYELTMMQGYFKNKEENRTVIIFQVRTLNTSEISKFLIPIFWTIWRISGLPEISTQFLKAP